MPQPAPAPKASPPRPPTADVDYGIIIKVQLLGVILMVALLVAEFVLGLESIHGHWIICTPFLPAALWNMCTKDTSTGSSSKSKLKGE